jgi:hypothetical protein
MHVVIFLAALQGFISIPPIRVFQPYPDVRCPHGYSIWWPAGKEFENDRYAECIKPIVKSIAGKSVPDLDRHPAAEPPATPVSLKRKAQPLGR